ncbi:23S rRNA (cytidine(2498)-2'-O)-methyltransferase RlmM [Methylomagnum sp.]
MSGADVADGLLLLYCRAGFEKECAAEILARAGEEGVTGYVKAKPDSGFVLFIPPAAALDTLRRQLLFDDLAFARQMVFAVGPLTGLPTEDRITPLLDKARNLAGRFSGAFMETADTNEAKELAVFLRKFAAPFDIALKKADLLGGPGVPRLHVFFLDSATAYVGVSVPGNAAPWLMGIPRLKFPSAAPSRSTLKLEEAFLTFVGDPERELRPGMTAVDLGAAPGGWTWQLVKRHIRTVAVDNGPLAPALLESGIVEHLRMDGFRYRPPKPVDWLVCDMVEQPGRIAALVADWFATGLAGQIIFNLKLPMKKRFEEVERARATIQERAARAGIPCRLRFKQLYHDRAEVTGYLSRIAR